MKNIQVIDAALNCAYDVYAATEEDFLLIFPEPGQDIQFIEEISSSDINPVLARLWKQRLSKPQIEGIHGTLFYELSEKKRFYPNRQEQDLTDGLGRPQN